MVAGALQHAATAKWVIAAAQPGDCLGTLQSPPSCMSMHSLRVAHVGHELLRLHALMMASALCCGTACKQEHQKRAAGPC